MRIKIIADKIEFNRLRALARYKLKKGKRNSWMKYVGSLNRDTALESIWKKFKKIDRKGTSLQQPILEKNNGIITDPKLVMNKIAQSLASISSLDRCTPNFIRYKNVIESNNLSFNEAHI